MKKRILLVDDCPFFLKILQDLLAEEFLVETAISGEKAIDMLQIFDNNPSGESKPFDLVITDLIMPGLSGYDVAQFVRGKNREHKFTPVLMLTENEITEAEARKHGCSLYLPKSNLEKVLSMSRILLTR